MLRKTKLLTGLITAGLVTGCSSMPDINDYQRQSTDDAYQQALNSPSWSSKQGIVKKIVKIGKNQSVKNVISDEIRNKQVDIQLQPDATFRDLMTGLGIELGINTLVKNQELSNKGVYIPQYKGKLGDLLDTISHSLDVSFVYREQGGVLILSDSVNYMIKVANTKGVLEIMANNLEKLGATEVIADAQSSNIIYNATSSVQDRVNKYIDTMIRNTASITLQILAINVNLTNEKREGFDWTSLQASIGQLGMSAVDLEDRVEGVVGVVTGNSVSGQVSRGDVDIEGVFNILNKYGKATTSQDIYMETTSGMSVKVKSVQKQPYITDLTTSTTSDSVTNSGIDTDETENGIELEFSPFYDSESGLISMDVDLNLSTLLEFEEFTAGDKTLRLPNTQEQSFNNTLRMQAGETKVIGGISYHSRSDNRNRPVFFDGMDKGASKNTNITENSLFIVVRPTVVEYVPERLGGEL
tara:strand:- start:1917 stop:3323 length:1407 start_codon:yes stop_codon:yes gene_type:complete